MSYEIIKVSWPLIFAFLFLFSIETINIYYIGKEGSAVKIAGLGMGLTILEIVVFAPILGISYS
jgi:Na+-driven multidrug efflux pump